MTAPATEIAPPASRRRGGFTLAEVMVVVAIMGIVASIAPKMFIEVSRFFIMNRVRTELQKESREALVLITRNLRQASANSIQIDRFNTTQPFYSRIRFTKAGSGVQYSFYQNGKNLVMTWSGRTKTIAKDLRYAAFALPKSDDLSIVSVAMTFEQQIYQGKHKALHLASEKVRVMNP